MIIHETSHIPHGITENEAYLVTADSPESSARVFIDGVLTIGRHDANDLQLHDLFVSAEHCQIEKRPSGFFIRDLKSRNGIKINGIRVTEGELLDGTDIQIGSSRFLFKLGSPPERSSAPLAPGLHSKNKAWAHELRALPSIAVTELPVFLRGESGTGKEVVAHLIHELSARRNGPFVSVNCSALTESLVESELFGHVRGSYTGATTDRKGAFETARGGTLFLDEIGDLPLSLQPKLLRAIENQEIRPVGSDKNVATDLRIVVATHKNIEDLVRQGQFRADLYYRVHVIKVNLPPLKSRLEDFEDLLYVFCKEHRVRFSVSAIAVMKEHTWPGNIRELKNTVARARALFPQKQIMPEHIHRLISTPLKVNLSPDLRDARLPFLKEVEKEVIKSRLEANNGNQRKTAVELGIPKSTLHDRIRAYGIDIRQSAVFKSMK